MSKKYSEVVSNVSASTIYSSQVDIQDAKMFSVQITMTNGTAFDATCTLQVCNSLAAWVDVADSSAALAGSSDAHIYDITESGAALVRVKVVVASGTGDLDFDWVLK